MTIRTCEFCGNILYAKTQKRRFCNAVCQRRNRNLDEKMKERILNLQWLTREENRKKSGKFFVIGKYYKSALLINNGD